MKNPYENDNAPPVDSICLNERLAFLDLSEKDADRLRGMIARFAPYADEVVESFYRHLYSFDATARLLSDPQLVARLKKAQREHFASLLEAEWDESYVEQRQRVGQAHAEVELDPHLFLGAYNQYVQNCFKHFAAEFGPEASDCANQILSLIKVVFLDIGLTLDAYFYQATIKLRQALDMYWKANHDLRQFAQLTSHDLKTPIATVANLCEETLDEFGERMPDEAADLIATARERTFQISRIIDELLESTLTFQSEDARDEVSSQAIICEAVERVRPELDKKKIKVKLPESFPYVWGNKSRLREAFYNLISNAAKFIEGNHGHIEIAVKVDNEHCEFTVIDDGPGIPEEDLTKIFAPFRRLRTHANHPGTGLGLYFAKHIIEDEGGRIWAESAFGHGSEFHVMLRRGPRV